MPPLVVIIATTSCTADTCGYIHLDKYVSKLKPVMQLLLGICNIFTITDTMFACTSEFQHIASYIAIAIHL